MSKKQMTKQEVVDKNYEAFQKLLPEILSEHANQFALMRNCKVDAYFDTAKDALTAGSKLYDDDLFSIQEVMDKVIDLGFFSHAVS